MDIRRLYAFTKIVDIGSITRASSILHIAQPALSQQIASLESHFGKTLLVRSKRGVVPTEAGKVLYRHCQIIIKQMEQAELEIVQSEDTITGVVSVGFAPLSLGSLAGTQLVEIVRQKYPGIIMHVNENVGEVISELIMAGKMDVALIFNPGGIPGILFEPVQTEELYFVTKDQSFGDAVDVPFAEAISQPLVLPNRIHTVRQVIDTTLARTRLSANVIVQTESFSILAGLMDDGVGATILPHSAAIAMTARVQGAKCYRISNPNMVVNMAIGISGQLPLSEPASVVLEELTELAQRIAFETKGSPKIFKL